MPSLVADRFWPRSPAAVGPMTSPLVRRTESDCRRGRSADHADQGVAGPGAKDFTTRRSPLRSKSPTVPSSLSPPQWCAGAARRPAFYRPRGQPVGQPQSGRAIPNHQRGQPPRNSIDGAVDDGPGGPAGAASGRCPSSARQAVRCGIRAARAREGWRGRRFSPAGSGSVHMFVTASRALLASRVHMPGSPEKASCNPRRRR